MDKILPVIKENRWYIAGCVVGGYLVYKLVTRPRNLPPGPRGLPVLGTPWELSDNMQEDGVRLSKKYNSDIISVRAYGQ